MLNTGSQFVACVRIETKLPHLVLEEIEHHLFSVRCFKSRIELQFTTEETATAAAARLGAHRQFLIITSYLDCNKDGKRETYL